MSLSDTVFKFFLKTPLEHEIIAEIVKNLAICPGVRGLVFDDVRPVRVEELAYRLVEPFVGVRSEKVPLSL